MKRAYALFGMLPLLAAGADYEKCALIVSGTERLACYDQAAAQVVTPSAAPAEPARLGAEPRPEYVAEAGSFLGQLSAEFR